MKKTSHAKTAAATILLDPVSNDCCKGGALRMVIEMFNNLFECLSEKSLTGAYTLHITGRSDIKRQPLIILFKSESDKAPHTCYLGISLHSATASYNCTVTPTGNASMKQFRLCAAYLMVPESKKINFDDQLHVEIPGAAGTMEAALSSAVVSKPPTVMDPVPAHSEPVNDPVPALEPPQEVDNQAGLAGFYDDETNKYTAFHLLFMLGTDRGVQFIPLSDYTDELTQLFGNAYRFTSRGVGKSIGRPGIRAGILTRLRPNGSLETRYCLTEKGVRVLRLKDLVTEVEAEHYLTLKCDTNDVPITLPANATLAERLVFLEARSKKYLEMCACLTELKVELQSSEGRSERLQKLVDEKQAIVDNLSAKLLVAKKELEDALHENEDHLTETVTSEIFAAAEKRAEGLKEDHEKYRELVRILG